MIYKELGIPKSKVCTECERRLPISEYYFHTGKRKTINFHSTDFMVTPVYYRSFCKECTRTRRKVRDIQKYA